MDDSVKYSVRMPDGQKRKVYCTYASSWGRNAEFNFCAVDAVFKDLTADAKMDYMFERIRYQNGITDGSLNALGRYISRNAREITERIVLTDAVEDLIMLEPYGILKKNSAEERLDQANKGGALMCAAWILQWINSKLPN